MIHERTGSEGEHTPSGPFLYRHRLDAEAGSPAAGLEVAYTSVEAGNLAFHVLGSEPEPEARADVARRRRGLEDAMGVPHGSTVYVQQVHSADVVDAPGHAWGADTHPVDADAIVSARGEEPLAIMVADCLPVVVVDRLTGASAVAHAGRAGLLAGILENTLERLRDLRPSHERDAAGLEAWIGPGICGRCYEVPQQMQDDAVRALPAVRSTTSWGTPALDLPAGAEHVLTERGVVVHRVPVCTREDERLFSHRRAPGRGRFVGLVWRAAAESAEEPVSRAAEIAAGLGAVRERIREAAAAAGLAAEPTLVAVTKTHPAADVVELVRQGVTDVGENRDQEARPKAAEVEQACRELSLTPPRWHCIGQLQTNKAKYVVRYAAAVHSVDRPELVAALSRAMVLAAERERAAGREPRAPLECLVQVDLDPRPAEQRPAGIGQRGGAAPEQVGALASAIAEAEGLVLTGLMCVAPRGLDPAEAFARLARLGAELRADHPGAVRLSMGMSADLEQAVAAGATHLRVGSDILGARAAVG